MIEVACCPMGYEGAPHRARLESGRPCVDALRILVRVGADVHRQILARTVGALEVHVDLVHHPGVQAEHRDLHSVLADPAAALERGDRVASADRLRGRPRLGLDAPRDRGEVGEARAAQLEEADERRGAGGSGHRDVLAAVRGDLEAGRATAGDEHGKEGADQARGRDHARAEPALPREG